MGCGAVGNMDEAQRLLQLLRLHRKPSYADRCIALLLCGPALRLPKDVMRHICSFLERERLLVIGGLLQQDAPRKLQLSQDVTWIDVGPWPSAQRRPTSVAVAPLPVPFDVCCCGFNEATGELWCFGEHVDVEQAWRRRRSVMFPPLTRCIGSSGLFG